MSTGWHLRPRELTIFPADSPTTIYAEVKLFWSKPDDDDDSGQLVFTHMVQREILGAVVTLLEERGYRVEVQAVYHYTEPVEP